MLKKLAKYGNSTTLVIDKAILELLNMDESTTVKLRTDGTSLIITPVGRVDKEKVSYTGLESAHVAVTTLGAEQLAKSDPVYTQAVMPAIQEEFAQVFAKHKDVMQQFMQEMASSEEFQDALTLLAQKYDPVAQPLEYVKELQILKMKHFPVLAELDKELANISEKYTPQ